MEKATNLFVRVSSVLLLLVYSISAQAVTLNSTSFPDAKFRAALTQITGTAEGGTFDATTYTSLDLSGKGITNLAGINNFTNLETLNIANNNLSSAPDFSSNTKIKYLDMTNSGVIGEQGSGVNKTVTIPKLVNLETLILANNPKVTCVNVSNATNLKYLDLSNTDLWFQNRQIAYGYFSQANKNTLETFLADNCNWVTAGDFSGFQNLKTVVISNNRFSHQNFINCPALETIDVSGNTSITSLSITNSSLETLPQIDATGCTNLASLTLDANNFNTLPEISISTVKYLSMKNNAFPVTYTIDGNTQFLGLDLGNNPFQSLTVKNSSMSALSLAGNINLVALHLHGNANLTKTASVEGINAAQGLYIKGLAGLKVLDIENSSFDQLGQNNSTEGCTGITHLKAAHNKFKTFSNAYKTYHNVGDHVANANKNSLEHLTGLTHLDLSNNELQDSLHLFKNTLLDTLIVHHNRVIERYDNLTDYLAHTKVVNGRSVNGGKGKAYPDVNDYGAYNDTTGLRMINLKYNPKVKYIDISYTAIKNTASAESYMNNYATKATETLQNREPQFIYIRPCNESLEEIYADYNGMMTFGYTGIHYDKLKRISQIETRGQHANIMKGSLNVNGNEKRYVPNLEYVNIANSDLDSIGVTQCQKLKYLNVSGNWTRNNWAHWSKNGEPAHTLNLKKCDALVECIADNTPYLKIVQANDRTELSSLSLTQDPANTALMQVYVPNTGLARINNDAYNKPAATRTLANSDEPYIEHTAGLGLAGIGTAKNLQLLYCEDNSHLTSLDVTGNPALKYLHAYNNKYGADGLDLSHNAGMVSAWVSNSDLEGITLTGCAVLDTLKCYDNKDLEALEVDMATGMRYLDLARCHVRDLDVTQNAALEYFDCSNDVKCTTEQGNWISDLNFASSALKKVYASNNNLFNIKLPASLPSLTNIEYEHNHINGIDLSGASVLAAANIKDQDNGRTIVAECSAVGQQKVYYFQLLQSVGDAVNAGYDTFLGSKDSFNDMRDEARRTLAEDDFDVDNVVEWTAGTNGVMTGAKKAALTGDLSSDKVMGKIVVLVPTTESSDGAASGHAEYTYNNGKGNSTFYLDWTAAGIVTAVDDVDAQAQVASVTYYNLAGVASQEPFDGVNLVVKTMTDGTTVTTKIIK